MAKIKNTNFYYSFNELVGAMSKKDSEALQQGYLESRLEEDLQSKTPAERAAILEAAKRGAKSFDMRQQFALLQKEAEAQGYQAVFSYDKSNKIVRTHLIPLEEKSILDTLTKGGKLISSSQLAKKFPTIQQAIEVGGFLDRYGQRGINALYLESVDDNATIITAQQKMLSAAIKSLKTKRGQEALRARDKNAIERLAKKAQSKASESLNVAGAYVPLTIEGKKSLSGTGSPEQLRNRRNTLHYDAYLSSLVKENFKGFLSGKKDSGMTYKRFGENVQTGLNLALNIMAQYRDDPQKAFEIIEKEPALKFISQTSAYKKIRTDMMKVAKMGLNIGLSGDKAFEHQEASLLPHAGAIGGFAEPLSSRKQQQVENYFNLNLKKINVQSKIRHTKRSRLFSAQELTGKHRKDVKDLNNRLYGIADVTQEDVAAVMGDAYLGIGLDGIALAEDIANELHGLEIKTGKIAKEDYDKRYEELVKQYKGKKTPEQIKKDVVRSLLKIEGNFDINQFKQSAPGQYSVEYGIERDAKTGTKFLLESGRGRSSAVFITRQQLEAILAHKGYSKEEIAGISGIRQASTIKGKNISGVITEALQQLFSEINTVDSQGREVIDRSKKKALMEVIANSPELKNYIQWDAKKGVFVTQGSELSLKEGKEGVKQLESIFETINEAYKKVTGKAQGLFEWKDIKNAQGDDKSGWFTTQNFIARTAIRQMAETPYGAPGGPVVSVDYRARGAIDRTLGMISAQVNDSLEELHKYLTKAFANTEDDAKKFKRISDDVENAREKTLKTLEDNFQIDTQKDIVFGWGEQYGEYNLENFEEADEEMKQNRTSSGHYRADLYAKSSFAAIQKAQEEAAKKGGTVYFDPQMGYQTVVDPITGKTFGGKMAALSTFDPVPIYDENGQVVAYTLIENKVSAFSEMAFASRRAVEDPSTEYNQYMSQDAFVGYYTTAANDVQNKEGTTYTQTNKKRLTHSAMTKSVAANYSVLGELLDNIEKEKDPVKKAMMQQQFDILSGSVQMSEADVRGMLDINSQQVWDENSKRYIYKQESEEDKNLILKTAYDQLYGAGEADNFKTKVIDDIKKRKEHYLKESKQKYIDEVDEILYNQLNAHDTKPVQIIDAQGNVTYKNFATPKEKADYFLEEAKKRYENRNIGIEKANSGVLTDSAFNQALIDKIVQAITIGSAEYNKRVSAAAAKGETAAGLGDILFRFPLSSGLDSKYTELFINKSLKAGTSAAGLGIWQELNGDNDGDKMANFLALADADALKTGDPDKINEQIRKVIAIQKGVSKAVTVATLKEQNKAVEGLSKKEIEKFANQEAQRTSAVLSRMNKAKVGQFSNEYQAVTEAMTSLGIDETGVGSDIESQMRAAQAMITRGIFESLTQDAISSKKVADRISKKYGSDALINEDSKFYSELDELIRDLTKDETYKDKESLQKLMKRLTNMGILGSDEEGKGAFATRINAAIVERISQYSNGEALIRQLFGDQVGTDYGAFKRKIDKGEITLNESQLLNALISTNTSMAGAGGIGAVIRNRYFNVPGVRSAEPNPAASLGINITSDNKAFKEYNKTLKETKELADAERKSEENKIVVANKETAAILKLAEAYGGLYGSLNDVNSVDKVKLLDELLNASKWNEDPLGITNQVKKQFGVTYEDRGIGRTVSHFLQSGIVSLEGRQYSIKDFNKDTIGQTKVSDRVWLDENGQVVTDQDTLERLNRMGYDKDLYDQATRTYGALSYGNIAHTTAEIMQDLGLNLSDLGNITQFSDFQKVIEDRLTELEKSDPERAKMAREKWNEDRDSRGYGGGTPLYVKEYAESLRTIGKSEEEINEAIAEKIKIGAQYANAVTEGGRLETLSEQDIGVPDINTKIKSNVDNIAIDQNGNIIVTDYKTKSGAIHGNEVAQVGRYTYALQGAAVKIAENNFENAQQFMESGLGSDAGWTKDNPLSEALFKFLQRAIEGARKDIEEVASKMNFSSEDAKNDYIKENLSSYIFNKFNARILRGSEKGGESTFLSSSILSQKLEGVDPADRAVLEKLFKGGYGQKSEISNEEEQIILKYLVTGQGAYDRWGGDLKQTQEEIEKQRNENAKNLRNLLSQKLKLEKEIAAYLKEQSKYVEGSEAYNEIQKILRYDRKQLRGVKANIKDLTPLVDKDDLKEAKAEYNTSKSKDDVADKAKSLKELDALYAARTSKRYELLKYQKRYNLTSPLSREIPYLEEFITTQSAALEELEQEIAGFIKDRGLTDKDLENINKKYLDKDTKNQLLVGMSKQGSQNLFQKIGTSFKNMLENFTQMGAAYKIIGMLRNAMSKIVTAAQQLDKTMVDLRIVTGNTKEETNELMSSYSKLGGELSATTTEVANAANSWLRQGYSIGEVNDLISASMHLSKLGMIESGQATEYLTSMLKGFKLEASDAMDVVSKLTKVDMEAATSAGSIAESLRQFATTAQLSGVDIDQAIAMATTIMDVSQKDASSVGHALNTMIARYGNVKAGAYTKANLGEESSDTTEKLNDIEKVLNKIGISMRTTSLEFRDFDEVLEDVAAKWQDLDNVSQNAIATAIAGTRQRESFLVLMENMDKYHDLIETSAESKGTAEEKYLSYTEQLEAAQKRLNAAWEDIALNADVNSFLTKITDVTTFLVKHLPFIVKLGMRILTAFNAYKLPTLFELPEKMQKLQGFLGKTAGNVTSGFKSLVDENGHFSFKNLKSKVGKDIDSNLTKMGQYSSKSTSILGKLQNTITTNIKALRDNTSAIKGEETSTTTDDLKKNLIDGDKEQSSTGAGKLWAGAAQFGLNALVSGATASTIGRNRTTGEDYEMSNTAVWTNRIVTGLAGGIGSMINPILGPIFSAAADFIMSKWLGPLIDRVDNLIKHQIEVAENNLSLLSKIETSTSELTKISKEKDTYENYQKIQVASEEMLDVLKEDSELSIRLLEVLAKQGFKYNDIYELVKDWKQDSDNRDEISRQLEIATKQLEYENTVIAKQKELSPDFTKEIQFVNPDSREKEERYYLKVPGETLSEVEQNMKRIMEEDPRTVSQLEKKLQKIQAMAAQQTEAYEELNKNLAEQAILGAKTTSGAYLTDLSVNQLKNLGKDEIVDIVTQQIQSLGGFKGYDAWSKEGQDIVASVIKADEKLYKIYSQQVYTLDEAIRKNDPELLTQFANAMGVTVDQLDRLSKTMGTLTLADFFKTPTEVRNSFDELSSLFTSLGSSSGLTAENLEKIISDYPQLIGDLGDTHKLATGIIKNMNAYKELYKNTLIDSLLDNTSYFDLLQEKLTDAGATASVDAIKSLDVKTIRELMRSLDKIDKDGVIKAAIDELFDQDITVDFEKSLLETIINYQSKEYDKQIKNLEEQKTALQEINNQREYENKLIEARNKLEDAQKEKKKIYRAGVGWVYESDQSAILEAQKNLEDVTNEKKISEIQAQIDQLTGEKEQLTELPDKLELKNLKTVYEAWAEELKTSNSTQAQILEKIIEAYKGLNISTSGDDAQNRVNAADNNTRSEFAGSLTALNEAIKNLGDDTTTSEYSENEKKVNASADTLFDKIDSFVSSGGSLSSIPEVQEWYDTQKHLREYNQDYKYSNNYSPTFEMGDTGTKYRLIDKKVNDKLTQEINSTVITGKADFKYYKPKQSQEKLSYKTFQKEYKNINNAVDYLPSGTFVTGGDDHDWGIILKGNDAPNGTGIYKVQKAAKGSLGLKGGMSLINELGTEALVTPGGTITSLPSATGVVPADITKNLWALGEVAPMFAKAMKTGFSDIQGFGTQDKSVDESFNVGTVNMTVNADNTFDVDKWVNELKVKTALSRNIR